MRKLLSLVKKKKDAKTQSSASVSLSQPTTRSPSPVPDNTNPPSGSQINSSIINSTLTAGNDINVITIGTLSAPSGTLDQLNTGLKPVEAAYDSYVLTSERRPKCFEGTRVALLNKIDGWIEGQSNQASIYVVDGIAGIGKSTVAQTVAEKAAIKCILGASFFFSRSEEKRSTARYFFTTIAFHLARFHKAIADQIINALKEHPDIAQKTLQQQFSILILKPLQDSSSIRPPVLLVVDALDECEQQEATTLLDLFAQNIQLMPQLRIFITTRPEWHIRDVLGQYSGHERFHLQDIEESIVQSDVRLYLDFLLSVKQVKRLLPSLRIPWQPTEEERTLLYGVCGTLFIIAATATRFILDNKRSDPQRQLARLLDGVSPVDFSGSKRTDAMDRFYIQILRSAIPEDLDDDDDWFLRYQTALGAVIVLQDPLPCIILARLLDVDTSDIEGTLLHLHSVVAPSGQDSIYRVYHKSFPDFITDNNRIDKALRNLEVEDVKIARGLLIDPKAHHSNMLKGCLRVMSHELKRNAWGLALTDQYKGRAEIPSQSHKSLPQDLIYACNYWASHLSAGCFDDQTITYLHDWACNHIPTWLEILSAIERIDSAYLSLEKACRSISDFPPSEATTRISELLSDALRFVQRSGEIFRLSPMHVYWSGLPFIPSGTTISQTYRSEGGVRVKAGLEDFWNPSLATLVGHSGSIQSISFSPDSSRLASASRDTTVRLWDGSSGALITILNQHSKSVNSVGFSKNSSRLVSGSDDHTARLWDGKTGVEIATLIGHSAAVNYVSFSTDGSKLVSASSDKTLRLWCAKTGAHVVSFVGHSNDVTSAMFLGEGAKLASCSRDSTVRLWDSQTGGSLATLDNRSAIMSLALSNVVSRIAVACYGRDSHLWNAETGEQVAILEGHTDSISSVAFSSDGLKLASASWDKTLRLWDGRSGEMLGILIGHTNDVYAVQFSPDGSRIASGSFDRTIIIWDTLTRSHLCILEGHSRPVKQVEYSNNGSRIASASDDFTIRLWDAKVNTQMLPVDRHADSVAAIMFSDEGSRFASASRDNHIKLWDSSTGALIATLKGHIHWASSVAFSPGGTQLASGALDGNACLWNVQTGAHTHTFGEEASSIHSVAFSPDGTHLASATQDKMIRLWKIETGAVTATLTGHFGSVKSVTFSPNGMTLASGSDDCTVRLWDRKTGDLLFTLEGHTKPVECVTFSRDGLRLASISKADGVLKLWDTQTKAPGPISTFEHDLYLIKSAAFCPVCFIGNTHEFNTSPQDSSVMHDNSLPIRLLTLIQRKQLPLSGLALTRLADNGSWEVIPICWLPPEHGVEAFGVDQSGMSVALGCSSGRVILLDLSGLALPW